MEVHFVITTHTYLYDIFNIQTIYNIIYNGITEDVICSSIDVWRVVFLACRPRHPGFLGRRWAWFFAAWKRGWLSSKHMQANVQSLLLLLLLLY
jgi:hypothetical protein